MSLRRVLSAVRGARAALARGTLAAVVKSILSVVIICCLAVSSPQSASAKPFTLSFPSWSLAGLVGREAGRRPGVKPYTGRRVGNDTLRMIYHHDQTVAVVELGDDKLLLNCELIETNDEEDMVRLLARLSVINRPLAVTFPQMMRLMAQCQQVGFGTNETDASTHMTDDDTFSQKKRERLKQPKVEGVESRLGEARRGAKGGQGGREKKQVQARLRAGGANDGLLGGSPLSLLQGIIPGTKWCGTGDIAADYHDLGAARSLDRCCRTHDLCPTKVRAFSRRYNLTNNSLYSKSHCACDDMLFSCLKATNTSAAQLMGHIYFNIVQVPCLADAPSGRQFRDAKEGF